MNDNMGSQATSIPARYKNKIDTLHLTTRHQWRQWLTKNHKNAKEIWLVYYRKETGKPAISYEDSVGRNLVSQDACRLDDFICKIQYLAGSQNKLSNP
jgi:hypothetical protein